MKKMKLFAIAALMLVATFSVSAQAEFSVADGKAKMTVIDMAPNTNLGTLNVHYTLTVDDKALEKCETMLFTVLIKNGDEKKVLDIIGVSGTGKQVARDWVEKQCYKVCNPNYVNFYTLVDGEDLVVEKDYDVPFDVWMDGAELHVVSQAVTSKPTCIKNVADDKICNVPYLVTPFNLDPQLVVVPVATPNPQYTQARVIKTRVYYPVNVTKEIESYLENKEAISILNTLHQDNFEVATIAIEGWASPESSVSYNKNLSLNRAKNVKNIIAKKYKFDADVYKVAGNGEYWDLVADYVNTTDEAVVAESREAIKAAIADNADLDKREAAIKKINAGKPYKAIFNAVYPRSRFADCTVTYKVKEFNYDNAMAMYAVDPEQLTADEYVNVLKTHYSAEVAEAAVKVYPNDERLNAFAGWRDYQAGDYKAAAEKYEKAGQSEEVYNNLACCYIKLGETAKAEDCLAKAKEVSVYDYNAVELRKAVLNNKYFAK